MLIPSTVHTITLLMCRHTPNHFINTATFFYCNWSRFTGLPHTSLNWGTLYLYVCIGHLLDCSTVQTMLLMMWTQHPLPLVLGYWLIQRTFDSSTEFRYMYAYTLVCCLMLAVQKIVYMTCKYTLIVLLTQHLHPLGCSLVPAGVTIGLFTLHSNAHLSRIERFHTKFTLCGKAHSIAIEAIHLSR